MLTPYGCCGTTPFPCHATRPSVGCLPPKRKGHAEASLEPCRDNAARRQPNPARETPKGFVSAIDVLRLFRVDYRDETGKKVEE